MHFVATARRRLFGVEDLGVKWAQSHTQAPNALVLKDRVRVFFSTREVDGMSWKSRIGFADFDPTDDFKMIDSASMPSLDLGEMGAFDMFGVYPASVIADQGGFLMAYGGWSRPLDVPFEVAIGIARSTDGKAFERISRGPALGKTQREPFVISSPKIRRFGSMYHIFYISGVRWVEGLNRKEPIYKIRSAFSEDGINWNRIERDLIEEKIAFESQASPDVFFLEGHYHMLFSYRGPSDYLLGQNSYKLGYARSRDLISWERQDEVFPFPASEEGWDSDMIAYPNFFMHDGKYFLLFTGNGVGKSGIGLAEIGVNL